MHDFKLPAKLYHGTRSSLLPAIAKEGLRPREASRTGNWSHTLESRCDAVYLTTAYALHYATCCQAEGDPTILEIDTSMLPLEAFGSDEDGVALLNEGSRQAGPDATLVEAARYWRERIHTVCPAVSLQSLGNCTFFGRIPPQAVQRVLVLAHEDAVRLVVQACDPVIVPMNYRLFGPQYRAFTAWLFEPTGPCPGTHYPVEPPAARPRQLAEFLSP